MQPFNFLSAKTSADALKSAKMTANTRYLAGGTNLLDLMKLHVEKPDHVIDVTNLAYRKISESHDAIMIGSMVTNSELAENPIVVKEVPFLSEALLAGASVQLRNLATVGGNLLQRTRCPYFRDTSYACNKRHPGTGCSAIKGYNRMHAIMGTSAHCIAANPSDMNVALAAAEAKIHVTGETGVRVLPIGEFFRVPGETPQFEVDLKPGELISAVEIPKKAWLKKSTYVKVRDRASYAFALTSVALALDLDGRKIRNVRVAFGGIGTVPWRSHEAEDALKGKTLTAEVAQSAGDAAVRGAVTHPYNKFKVALAGRNLVRALSELGGLT